jgi:hypothetical protein
MSKGRRVPPAAGIAEDGTGTLKGIVSALRGVSKDNPEYRLMQLAAGHMEDMARRTQPKHDRRGMVELAVETLVSAATGAGIVQLSIGEQTMQVSPTAARGYALQILAAAADAESEAAVTAELRELDFPLPTIGDIIVRIRATRAAREAQGATSA